jgi:hypothetical protein
MEEAKQTPSHHDSAALSRTAPSRMTQPSDQMTSPLFGKLPVELRVITFEHLFGGRRVHLDFMEDWQAGGGRAGDMVSVWMGLTFLSLMSSLASTTVSPLPSGGCSTRHYSGPAAERKRPAPPWIRALG